MTDPELPALLLGALVVGLPCALLGAAFGFALARGPRWFREAERRIERARADLEAKNAAGCRRVLPRRGGADQLPPSSNTARRP